MVLIAQFAFVSTGCPAPQGDGGRSGEPEQQSAAETRTAATSRAAADAAARVATAKAEDVDAAKALLDGLGANAKYTLLPGEVMTEIVIRDGSTLSAEDIALFGKLTDLETLQILNFRSLNDEMAAQLAGLKNLTTLALTNSVIGDPTVEMIVKSFPNLTDLDLSSNTNMTNGVLKVICELSRARAIDTRSEPLQRSGDESPGEARESEVPGSPRQHGSGRHDHGDHRGLAETRGAETPQYDGHRFRHGVPGPKQDAQVRC